MGKSSVQRYTAKDEQALITEIWRPEIADNPLAFVKFIFPWKQPGTPLQHYSGPRQWQADVLAEMAEHIQQQKRNIAEKQPLEVFREAISSGRGPGKSTMFAWLVLWFMSTRIGGTAILTANTESQLKSVTFGEIGKWTALALNSHWWDQAAMSIKPAPWFGELIRKQLGIGLNYYYAEAKLWSDEVPDAFAGIHSEHGVLLIFDEASGIPESIWQVSEGYFTSPVIHRYWLAASNPRRNTGAFFQCFHKDRNYWRQRKIDSRTVEGTDPVIYQRIVDRYGIDSDEVRVEVLGEFPRQGEQQFIPRDIVQEAMEREVPPDMGAPLVMGVDVARFGDDKSVIVFRKGRDAKSVPMLKFKGLNTHQLSRRIAEEFDARPDCRKIFVDGAGVGGGVVDLLKDLGYPVVDVQSAAKADDPVKYANKRVEMWGDMREWLVSGAVEDDSELFDDLTEIFYHYDGQGRLLLERKDQMKKRGLASPDCADPLAYTFAQKVARDDLPTARRRRSKVAHGVDYAVI